MTLTDVGHLQKGMTLDEAKSALPIEPKNEFDIATSSSSLIHVCSYTLSSGDYKSNYFLAFIDSKLAFWGYAHEYARAKDMLINEIGEKAVAVQMKAEQNTN
jgi:hypothetical protein